MGVKGLWQLVLPCGKVVNVESLQGKILAVDISIWLNKLAKASQSENNADSDRYLILIFHRICKLLFYGIKPVFVFDGGVPDVKKKTLIDRKRRRIDAETLEYRTQNLITKNKLQMKAIEFLSRSDGRQQHKGKAKKKKTVDIFQIPGTSSQNDSKLRNVSSSKEDLMRLIGENVQKGIANMKDLDIEGDDFKSLPSEVQHEILVELKDLHRKRSRHAETVVEKLPEEAGNFSEFQLKNVIKSGKITNQIDSLRKEMNSGLSNDFIESNPNFSFPSNKTKLMSKKNISQDNQKFVLVKKKRSDEVNKLFNSKLFDHSNAENSCHSYQQTNSHAFSRIERTPANLNPLKSCSHYSAKPARFLSESSDDDIDNDDVINKSDDALKLTHAPIKVDDQVEYMSSSSTDDDVIENNESNRKERGNFLEEVTPEYNDSTEINFPEINEPQNHVNQETSRVLDSQKEEYLASNKKDIEEVLPSTPASTPPENELINEDVSPPEMKIINAVLNNEHVEQNIDNDKNSNTEKDVISEDENSFVNSKDSLNISDKGVNEKTCHKEQVVSHTESSQQSDKTVSNNDVVPLHDRDVINVSDEIMKKERKEEKIPKKDVSSLRNELLQERQQLETKKRSHTMIATEVSNEMFDEVQDLLQLFGIPFVVSPTEAEAQCAFLETAQLVNGCITDDGDVFLFGAKNVYKNFFNQDKHIELFTAERLEKQLSLTRDKLVALAFLTGSDYTPGLAGVGAVTGMEILQEFEKSSPKDTLHHFKDWVKSKKHRPTYLLSEKVATRLKSIIFPRSFNSEEVWNAYLEPDINTSTETFEWGMPDQDSLRKFTKERFHWNKNRCDEYLDPVLKKCISRKKHGHDKTLDAYFPRVIQENTRKVSSKRLNRVLEKMKAKQETKK